MGREKFPHTLYRFDAETDSDYGGGYGGVIEPNMEPMTQRQYERFAKAHLDHYRRMPTVTRIVVTEFRAGASWTEERQGGRMVETSRNLLLDDYASRGGR